MTLAEAHKTGRKYRRTSWKATQGFIKPYMDSSSHYIGIENAIADDWETEPEVYEVECVVNELGGSVVMFGQIPKDETLPKTLINKRTKLTIELLD